MTSDGMKGPASLYEYAMTGGKMDPPTPREAPAASPAVGTREAVYREALERIRERGRLRHKAPGDLWVCSACGCGFGDSVKADDGYCSKKDCLSNVAARALAAPVPQQTAREAFDGMLARLDALGAAQPAPVTLEVELTPEFFRAMAEEDGDAPAKHPAQEQPAREAEDITAFVRECRRASMMAIAAHQSGEPAETDRAIEEAISRVIITWPTDGDRRHLAKADGIVAPAQQPARDSQRKDDTDGQQRNDLRTHGDSGVGGHGEGGRCGSREEAGPDASVDDRRGDPDGGNEPSPETRVLLERAKEAAKVRRGHEREVAAQQPAQVQPCAAFTVGADYDPTQEPRCGACGGRYLDHRDRAAQPSDTTTPPAGVENWVPIPAAPSPGLVPVAEVVRWLELRGKRCEQDERAADEDGSHDSSLIACGAAHEARLCAVKLNNKSWRDDLAALDAATKETTDGK